MTDIRNRINAIELLEYEFEKEKIIQCSIILEHDYRSTRACSNSLTPDFVSSSDSQLQ